MILIMIFIKKVTDPPLKLNSVYPNNYHFIQPSTKCRIMTQYTYMCAWNFSTSFASEILLSSHSVNLNIKYSQFFRGINKCGMGYICAIYPQTPPNKFCERHLTQNRTQYWRWWLHESVYLRQLNWYFSVSALIYDLAMKNMTPPVIHICHKQIALLTGRHFFARSICRHYRRNTLKQTLFRV